MYERRVIELWKVEFAVEHRSIDRNRTEVVGTRALNQDTSGVPAKTTIAPLQATLYPFQPRRQG